MNHISQKKFQKKQNMQGSVASSKNASIFQSLQKKTMIFQCTKLVDGLSTYHFPPKESKILTG